MESSTLLEAPPKKGRKAIAWKLIGQYRNKEELLAARRTEKVSKRKSDELRAGTKVTYRYALYKTDKLALKMFAKKTCR